MATAAIQSPIGSLNDWLPMPCVSNNIEVAQSSHRAQARFYRCLNQSVKGAIKSVTKQESSEAGNLLNSLDIPLVISLV